MDLTQSFRLAVANVANHGDTDVFPFPPENLLFRSMPDEVLEQLKDIHEHFGERLNTAGPTSVQALSPAGYTGFRWVTQVDPLWNAYFLGLVISIADKIEQVRLPATYVESHRLQLVDNEDRLFSPGAYGRFLDRAKEAADKAAFVVVTDIADFYQRVYHHRLENALRQDARCTNPAVAQILDLLQIWSGNTSYGLPIGGPASRLLSELLLNRVDQKLRAAGVSFVRYADDYRIFASSRSEAYQHLTLLSESLLRVEGLALSKTKTRVMARAEFLATLDSEQEAETESDDDGERDPAAKDRAARARRLLGFTVRFDPYSPNAAEDYENLKDVVAQLDIQDLFLHELRKNRIDIQLTRKLLHALQFAEPRARSMVCASIVDNLELLAPLFPQVMQSIREALKDVDLAAANDVRRTVAELVRDGSYLTRLGVNLGFAVRVIADLPGSDAEAILFDIYSTAGAANPSVQRDVLIAMGRRGATWFVSERKNDFSTQHPWVRRAMLMSSFSLGDEGRHWRQHVNGSLTQFEKLVEAWVSKERNSSGGTWQAPL